MSRGDSCRRRSWRSRPDSGSLAEGRKAAQDMPSDLAAEGFQAAVQDVAAPSCRRQVRQPVKEGVALDGNRLRQHRPAHAVNV